MLIDANIRMVVFDREPEVIFAAKDFGDGCLKAALIVWRRLVAERDVILLPAKRRTRR